MTLSTILLIAFGAAFLTGLILIYRAVLLLQREIVSAKQREKQPVSADAKPSISRQAIHDLNNLLGTIAGFTDAALEDLPPSSPLREDLTEVLEASERAKRLLKQLQQSATTQNTGRSPSSPPFTRTPSYPPVSPDLPPFNRTSSYPPVAKPVPVYEKPKNNAFLQQLPAAPKASSLVGDERTVQTGNMRMDSPAISTNAGGNGVKSGREHLLIVDDELQLLTMFRRVFEPRGYQVTTFSNGLIAWDDFQKHGDMYDLAILDQRMPEMSGTSLAIEMLNYRPDFPIILLSGFSDTISPDDATRIGIRKFLSKPIPQAELADTIRKTLDEPRYA